MSTVTNSFQYTRTVLASLIQQALDEVKRLGGNKAVEDILEGLRVPDLSETAHLNSNL